MIIEIIILIFATLDVILTYYQFDIDKKKGIKNLNSERNHIPRYLIKKYNNPTLHTIIQLTLFTTIIMIIHTYQTYIKFNILEFIAGMLFMVNIYHLDNIEIKHKNINDKEFWKIRKKQTEKY